MYAYPILPFISWEILEKKIMSREKISSSAFWIGSCVGGRWDCDGAIGGLYRALMQNHSL